MITACLITRPEHDDTTYYLSKWSENIITFANNKNIKIFDLHRDKANKIEVESRLKKSPCILVLLNGHGDYQLVAGHNNQPLIISGENEALLKSKITYAVSCKSAKQLCPKSIESGAINYTGYDEDFIFVYEPNNLSRPLQDETAKLFLEPSQQFVISLLKGNTIKESFERSRDSIKENLLTSLSGATKDTALARFLWWDLKHFVSHGNLDAKL
ncbi:hypothetical protein HY636_02320 [Candidatus Woesearchaeota archaeon]|nr:hypothetical protein [Candidatus Woesearchaeota archaeon]